MAKSSFRALFIAATLLAWSVAAQAAGLGTLTVLSNLGQPLRAEIDVVSVEKNELDSLTARLASVDAYLQNNLPYPSPSLGLKLSLEQRPSGEPYVSATTVQAVNEPFVDVLVELTWNGGRILRAYTALLDPPTYAVEEPAAAAAPEIAPPQVAAAPETAPPQEPQVPTQLGSEFQPRMEGPAAPVPEGASAMPESVAAAPGEAEPAATPAPPTTRPAEAGMPVTARPPAPMPPADTYGPVKYGDTLSKVALQYKPADITLDQVLVAMFRNNPEAFAGGNMNRLKTGKILAVPDMSEVAAVDAKVARQEVRMQTGDWNAYKERLAAAAGLAAPMPDQAGQAAGGQVTGMVEDKGPGAAGQPSEVLKLSKGDAPGAGAQARIRALEEEVAARERTIAEQRERVAKLEKTIKDMQALMEIKSKQGADLQKPATTPPSGEPGTAPMPAPAAPPALAETPKPEMPAVAAAPAESATASAPTAQTAPRPRKPKVVVAPPPAPGLIDQVLGEPLYLGAGAAVLALLGFVGFRLTRKRRAANEDFEAEAEKKNTDVAPLTATDSSSTIAAAERAAGSAQVTEEVDPLAEAEIYLAYGRDAQAEEILKEALAANPRRHEVHLKLLEIYAKRKDAAAFDPIARELHGATGGQGEIWQQAARLGYQLDPQNPRYTAGKPSGVETAAAAATAGAVTGGLEERLDFNIGLDDADVGTKTDIDLSRLAVPNGGTTTDIDLSGLGGADEAPPDIDLSTISGVPERTVQVPDVDFDIQAGEPGEQSNAVDFDLDVSAPAAAPAGPTSTQILDNKPMSQTVADAGEPGMGGLEFDLSNISLDMGDSGKKEPKLDMGSSGGGPDIDLSAINLDLGSDAAQAGGPGQAKDDRWYDVQTKFDLAKAYQEMGDKEGAREILREVIAEGDDEQKAAAQQVLETIA